MASPISATAQTSQACQHIQRADDDYSDNDDWFNKSLNEFEVPIATASLKSDRWSDEDEEFGNGNTHLAPSEMAKSHHDSDEADKKEAKGKTARLIRISPVGVTFSRLPMAVQPSFRLMLDKPWSVPRSKKPEGDGSNQNDASEGHSIQAGGMEASAEATGKTECYMGGCTSSKEDSLTESQKSKKGGNASSAFEVDANKEAVTADQDSKQTEDKPAVEPAGQKDVKEEKLLMEIDDEDDEVEIEEEEVWGNFELAHKEMKEHIQMRINLSRHDEHWFQAQLKALPTMFGCPQIFAVQRSILQKNQTRLNKCLLHTESVEFDSDKEEERFNEKLQKEIYPKCAHRLLAVLMKTDSGDFPIVRKTFLMPFGKEHDQQKGRLTKSSYLCMRTHESCSFLVVIEWLLGQKKWAKRKAYDLATCYPFSLMAAANLFFILWKMGMKKKAVEAIHPWLDLKEKKPEVYNALLLEEQAQMACCFIELGPSLIPVILEMMVTVVPQRPNCHRGKWHWARILRRLANTKHNWSLKMVDVVTKAVDFLIEMVQANEELTPLIASAAAELGDILNSCEFNKRLQDTVGRRALDAGLDAAKCFDIVMKDTSDSNLVRAGKYFRYKGQLKKSAEALKKAFAMQDSATVHHQLALTLKKMAVQESRRAWAEMKNQRGGRGGLSSRYSSRRQPWVGREGIGSISPARINAVDSTMAGMEILVKSHITYFSLSWEDLHVKDTLHHLNKALMLSHGEKSQVSYDLGLMYKELGEHSDALQQFLTIIELDEQPSRVVNAYEQSGLLILEKSSHEGMENKARKLQEDARSLLSMAILVQSHIVHEFRDKRVFQRPVWRSFHSLGQYLHLDHLRQPVTVSSDESPVEVWLLRLLRVYADTLPVLSYIQQYTHHEATDSRALHSKLNKYLRDQRYEDSILFISLLRLTNQWLLRSSAKELMTQAYILAARTKLTSDSREEQVGMTFNASIAKRYFKWIFEYVYQQQTERKKKQKKKEGGKRTVHTDMVQEERLRNTDDESEDDESEDDDSEKKKSGHSSMLYHVLLLHDHEDCDATATALAVQNVLKNTCGLQVHKIDTTAYREATEQAILCTHLILFIIGPKAPSGLITSLSKTTARFPDKPCLTLTLNNTPPSSLPAFLQNRPSFMWTSEQASGSLLCKVDVVCRLFCFLVGADIKF